MGINITIKKNLKKKKKVFPTEKQALIPLPLNLD